jgi:hypothetical protein
LAYFNDYKKQKQVPVVIYADFECNLEPFIAVPDKSMKHNINNKKGVLAVHKPNTFRIHIETKLDLEIELDYAFCAFFYELKIHLESSRLRLAHQSKIFSGICGQLDSANLQEICTFDNCHDHKEIIHLSVGGRLLVGFLGRGKRCAFRRVLKSSTSGWSSATVSIWNVSLLSSA